jgi:hypothetical protein
MALRLLLVYGITSLLVIGPQLWPLTELSAQTFDFPDAHISLWSLWWTGHALSQLQNPFWTDHVFYPSGTSLAFHSFPFGYGVLSSPLQWLVPGKAGLALCFNSLIFVSYVLSAVGAHLLALRVTGSRPGAWLAGYAFAFAPFHLLNSCRLAVLSIEVLPFYVLALLRTAERPSVPRALALASSLALAYYNSAEYALYLLFFTGLWLGWAVLRREPLPGLERPRYFALAALLFCLLAAPLLSQQLSVARAEADTVGHQLEQARQWSAALTSFVVPSRVHPLYGPQWAFAGEFEDGRTTGMRSETCLAWTVLALVGFALRRRSADGRSLWLLAAGVFFTLCLGPELRLTGEWTTSLPLPYALLYDWLPVMRAAKEPTRMFPLLLLSLSMLSAFGVRDLASRLPAPARQLPGLLWLLGGLVVFEGLTVWPWSRTLREPVAVSAHYETLRDDPRVVSIMDLTEADATLKAQPVHAKRTVEWQGFIPRARAAHTGSPLFELGAVLFRPQLLLGRPGAEQQARLHAYRGALDRAQVAQILLPTTAAPALRAFWGQLAPRLDATLEPAAGMLVLNLRRAR